MCTSSVDCGPELRRPKIVDAGELLTSKYSTNRDTCAERHLFSDISEGRSANRRKHEEFVKFCGELQCRQFGRILVRGRLAHGNWRPRCLQGSELITYLAAGPSKFATNVVLHQVQGNKHHSSSKWHPMDHSAYHGKSSPSVKRNLLFLNHLTFGDLCPNGVDDVQWECVAER